MWNSLYQTANAPLGAVTSTPTGMFGINWTSGFEESLELSGTTGNIYYHRGDGSVWTFVPGADGTYSLGRPQSQVATLTPSPFYGPSNNLGYWVMTLKSGETRYFDTNFSMLRMIEDRNHNVTTITRDASNRIIKVTDAAGRSLYFQYGISKQPNLVTSVTSDAGLSTRYQYDSNGCMIWTTKTDGETLSFDFQPSSTCLITAILDSKGKILESHSYDLFPGNAGSVGTSSSRANGVEALTLSY
jgi:YD repeat-containing protein